MSTNSHLTIIGASGYVGSNYLSSKYIKKFSRCYAFGDWNSFGDPNLVNVELISDYKNNKSYGDDLNLRIKQSTHLLFTPELRYLLPLVKQITDINPRIRIVCLSSTARFTNVNSKNKAWRISSEEELLASCLNLTMLRSNMIYGGQRDRSISKLLTLVSISPLIPLPYGNGGFPIIQPIHIDEVLSAIDTSLHHNYVDTLLTIAGPKPVSLNTFTKQLASTLNCKIIIIPISARILNLLASIISCMPLASNFHNRVKEFIPRFMESKAVINQIQKVISYTQPSYIDSLSKYNK